MILVVLSIVLLSLLIFTLIMIYNKTTEPTEPTVDSVVEPTIDTVEDTVVEPDVEDTVEATTEEAIVEPVAKPTVKSTTKPKTKPPTKPKGKPPTKPTVTPTVKSVTPAPQLTVESVVVEPIVASASRGPQLAIASDLLGVTATFRNVCFDTGDNRFFTVHGETIVLKPLESTGKRAPQEFDYNAADGQITHLSTKKCLGQFSDGTIGLQTWTGASHQRFDYLTSGHLYARNSKFLSLGPQGTLVASDNNIQAPLVDCVYNCVYPSTVLKRAFIGLEKDVTFRVVTPHTFATLPGTEMLLYPNGKKTQQLFTIDNTTGRISSTVDESVVLTDVLGKIVFQTWNANASQRWFLEHDGSISNRRGKVLTFGVDNRIVAAPATGTNFKRWYTSTNVEGIASPFVFGSAVHIKLPDGLVLDVGGRVGYKILGGSKGLPITHQHYSQFLWEILSNGHIKNSATRDYLEVATDDTVAKNPVYSEMAAQLWDIVKEATSFFIVNRWSKQRFPIAVVVSRAQFKKDGKSLRTFKDATIQRSRPLPAYNPPEALALGGKPFFDRFGNMVVLNNRSWKDYTGDSPPTGIFISYSTGSEWITYSLQDKIGAYPELYNDNKFLYDWGYDVFYYTTRLIFNRFNHAFVLFGSMMIKFDYLSGEILEFKSINGASKIVESNMNNNDYLYNDYPILVGTSLGLYNGVSYESFPIDINTIPNSPLLLIDTIQHSGMNTPGFTFRGKTYLVVASMHGTTTDSRLFSGGVYGAQTPHWLFVFDHATRKYSPPVFLGKGGGIQDWHNGPSIAIRSDGTIFVFFGNHNTPIDYVYTTKKLDVTSFVAPMKFPELKSPLGNNRQSFTYPGIMFDTVDNLYITYRGPFYGLSMFKIALGQTKATGKMLFDRRTETTLISGKTYDTIKVQNAKYTVWRDLMTVDKDSNVYLSLGPTFNDQTPLLEAQVGKFTVVAPRGNYNGLMLLEY
jgi:hypothetical protein